ncbi:hypothetical protein Tco_1249909, partial [Tanacetum coccineum]
LCRARYHICKPDGETIVSKGKMFEMGFFSLGKSKNRYLGIWYKNISAGEPGDSQWRGHHGLVITRPFQLLVWRRNGLEWFSGGSLVQLLDKTGNLVAWMKTVPSNKNCPLISKDSLDMERKNPIFALD